MSSGQKFFTTVLWGLLVLAMVSVISAGLFQRKLREAASPEESPAINVSESQPVDLNRPAPDFTLINEDGKYVSTASLKGSVWIAEFIFTHCAGPCKDMTAKFNELQDKIPDKSIKFVSISVDPERDTPDVLKTYGKNAGAEPGRWSFLTGDKQSVYSTARGMLVNVIPATDDSPLMHSEKFILVDAKGNIRSVVSSTDEAAMDLLKADAAKYAAEAKSLPATTQKAAVAP
jgi:cytochrome oxidase Cu insertion factor (SCO1/SenC/PrrC family)